MNIIPFSSDTQLPAHLRTPEAAAANNDLTAHAGGGFPVISIKGKTFAIVRDGERKTIPNPKDPDSPATHIDMVIVKANKNTSKVFYLRPYKEGEEPSKPDCYSNDGIRPMDDSEYKQNPVCATCKWNQWGSKVSSDGQGGKGKACQDAVRIAVSTPGLINDPYLVRVPPASIRALGELGSMLAKRGVSYQAVITRIAFVTEAATPQLTFKPMGFLDEPTYRKVLETADTDVVRSILGTNIAAPVDVAPVAPVITPEKTVTASEVEAAVAAAAEVVKPKPSKKAEPVKEAVPAAQSEALGGGFSLDLDTLKFDD
jgi:hypothetical protein